jgi:hypothetical protein
MSLANGPSGVAISQTWSISGVLWLLLPRGQTPLLSLLFAVES